VVSHKKTARVSGRLLNTVSEQAALNSGVCLDEFRDAWSDIFAPATTGKNTIVASARRGEMLLHRFRNVGAQIVRRTRLTRAGDIVELAFDGKESDVLDILRTH
jgi:hypothetical protein